MKVGTMNRLALSLFGSLFVAPLFASSAHAQTAFKGSIEVLIDGKEITNEQVVYVTAKQCNGQTAAAAGTADAAVEGDAEVDEDASTDDAGDAGVADATAPDGSAADTGTTDLLGSKFRFKLSSYTQVVNSLEVWATASTSDCSTADARLTNSTTTKPCYLLGSARGVSDKWTFEFYGTEIFKVNAQSQDSCPLARGTKYKVFFVPLANATDTSPAAPPAPIPGVLIPTAEFTLYTELPAAPGGVEGENGESELSIKWDKASGAMSTTDYKAYFDLTVGADATCGASRLKTNGSVPDDLTGIVSSGATKSLNASTSDLSGVAINHYVAAGVVTRDIAGNESKLSQVVCIRRVNTRSFMENCEKDSECKFESCSVQAPGWKTGGLLGLSLLFGLGVALGVRRRRHV